MSRGSLTLVTCVPVQHPKYLQDVAVAIVTLELVARAVEAQDELLRTPGARVTIHHAHDARFPREIIEREEVLVGLRFVGVLTSQAGSTIGAPCSISCTRSEMVSVHGDNAVIST